MAYTFLTPEQAWEKRVEYREDYYRKNIAVYSGDRSELNATSDAGMFWRRDSKCKMHVPVAADIAATSANLLFAEEPTFACYDEETEDNASDQQRRLDELVKKNNIHGKLNEGAESCAALGDVYLKLNWWKDEIDYPVLTVVQGDSAWPEFLFGVLKCIHFFSVATRDEKTDRVVRVYERYEPGKITMAVYDGTTDTLGNDMGDDALKDYGFEREVKPPVDDMLAVHIPNMKPNRQFRDTNMGRSDFDGLRPLMDSLDEAYSSWMRDVRLGKGRTIVPAQYLKRAPQDMLEGLAQSASWEFDPDIESYVAIDMADENGNAPGITLQQFNIRSVEHSATCAELLRNIVSIAGYAPQTFGMDIGGFAQSGTALHIREKKSYDTRGKKQTYWKAPLEQIMTAMIHLDNALWPKAGSDADDLVRVRFADSAANDLSTMASAVQLLDAANSASIETRVEMLHPDWTKHAIGEEIARLKQQEHLALVSAGIIGKAEFRAEYMDETPEQAAAAIQQINMQNASMEMMLAAMQAQAQNQAQAPEEPTETQEPEEQVNVKQSTEPTAETNPEAV